MWGFLVAAILNIYKSGKRYPTSQIIKSSLTSNWITSMELKGPGFHRDNLYLSSNEECHFSLGPSNLCDSHLHLFWDTVFFCCFFFFFFDNFCFTEVLKSGSWHNWATCDIVILQWGGKKTAPISQEGQVSWRQGLQWGRGAVWHLPL